MSVYLSLFAAYFLNKLFYIFYLLLSAHLFASFVLYLFVFCLFPLSKIKLLLSAAFLYE